MWWPWHTIAKASSNLPVTLLLIAHGSPDSRHREEIQELAERVQLHSGTPTLIGFLEHNEPSVEVVLDALERDEPVDVVGLFLTAGYHVNVDLPRVLEDARHTVPVLHGHLGVGDWVIPALEEAVGRPTSGEGAVLATVGSADPDAHEEVLGLAASWQRQRGSPVRPAFITGTGPTIDEALGMLTDAGCTNRTIALLVLAHGVLADRAVTIGDAHGVRVTPPLIHSPHVVERVIAMAKSHSDGLET